MARMAKGIGLKVVAWNRSPRPDAKVPMVDIDALLKQSDIVSLHLGLNDQTRGFLDRAKLQKLRRAPSSSTPRAPASSTSRP